MNQLKKHILFFDFLEKFYVSKNEVSKGHLNVIKKSNFVKKDKTIVRSSHPPLETVLVICKGIEVKASSFKIADELTPVSGMIEQNNFTKESLRIIGQQLDRIEKKNDEKTVVSKLEEPLIDLPSQREKLNFKTSLAKTLKIVEKMIFDLKVKIVKTEGTSTIATCTISRNEKKPIFESEFESLFSVFVKKVFDDDLPKIKRFVGKSNPMSFT